MNHTKQFYTYLPLALILVMSGGLDLRADDPKSPPSEESLIAVLKSDAPKSEKAMTCKKLAVWGSVACVDEVAKLLADPELTSWARIALENIPDPACDAALIKALDQVQGRSLIGVINSLGVRKTQSAVAAIAQRLSMDDEGVVVAAAMALGKIGGPIATDALLEHSTLESENLSAIAEGLNLISEQQLAGGDRQQAISISKRVLALDVSKIRKIEATRCMMLASRELGVPQLVQQLQSEDRDFINIGLAVARELQGESVSQLLVAAIEDVDEQTGSLLILALADRGDASVLPGMREVVKKGSPSVRIAAMEVLKEVGGVDSIDVLLASATDANEEIAIAATAALAELTGVKIDQDLVQRLDDADPATQIVLISLIGKRRIAAVQPLLKAANSEDEKIRTTALSALGQIATENELDMLIERSVASNTNFKSDREIALQSLHSVAVRLPDQAIVAEKLAASMRRVDDLTQVQILEILADMGGNEALAVIGSAAQSDSPILQDAATRLLGGWMTVDAGPILIELAQQPNYAFQVRALRGYLRLVRQFLMSDQQRVEMCRTALAAAERDAEKKLLLEVIGRYPSADMLTLAKEVGQQNPQLQTEAENAIQAIEKKLKK